ncbi:hypothetical protein B0H19DRAFT_1085972 [Mycena capillaripes]|nr:hypothetical protein B0H19DRAFT_1085972 [Mycena capillaripes]
MFNKSTLLFFALVASIAVAAPLPIPKISLERAADVCNATLVTDNIAQMQDTANQILAVGFPLPDPFRENPTDSATFDTVVSAIADAKTAAAAGDFATVATKISFVSDTTGSLLDGKVADGLESGIDLTLVDLAADTASAVAACLGGAAPAPAAAAPVPAATAPVPAATAPVAAAAASAPVVAAAPAAAAGTCDKATVQSNIAQLKDVANQILAVSVPLPDPFRENAADSATFDTVVSAISDAETAAAAGDFATVTSKVSFVADTTDSLLDGKVADGLESGIDLTINEVAHDTVALASACA